MEKLDGRQKEIPKSKILPPMKASEVLIHYTDPLLNEVPKGASPESVSKTLMFPVLIWNAVVARYWKSSPTDYLRMLQDQMRGLPKPAFPQLTPEYWINRKQAFYADELWSFEYEVVPDPSGEHERIIRAYVRLPDHLRENLPAHWGGMNIRSATLH